MRDREELFEIGDNARQDVAIDYTAIAGVFKSIAHKIRRHTIVCAIDEGSVDSRDRYGPNPGPLRVFDVGKVQHNTLGYTQPAAPPPGREINVHFYGHHIRETVEREGGFVGEHAYSLCPQPDHDEIFMLAGWKMHESVDTASDTDDTFTLQVLGEELR
jgi:hypothetical protein